MPARPLLLDPGDPYAVGEREGLRLHEKGGKHHEVPAHPLVREALDAYTEAGGLTDKTVPLFQSATRAGALSGRVLDRTQASRMLKRRARQAGLKGEDSPHSLRAPGITIYLENGGTLENAQAIAAHESPRTTKLYDRTSDDLSLDEIERIAL